MYGSVITNIFRKIRKLNIENNSLELVSIKLTQNETKLENRNHVDECGCYAWR